VDNSFILQNIWWAFSFEDPAQRRKSQKELIPQFMLTSSLEIDMPRRKALSRWKKLVKPC
jgi:hypothetical protein